MMALAFFGTLIVPLEAQNITIARAGDAIAVRAPGLGLLRGDTLSQLKDGRTVRVQFDLSVLPGPGGAATTQTRRAFVLSYDLWEERFAVTLPGPPKQSGSYLTAAAAEAWCLERVTVPLSELGKLRDAPFWIRLEYQILDGDRTPARDDDPGITTLKGIIEALSRRPKAAGQPNAVEAGPFRLR